MLGPAKNENALFRGWQPQELASNFPPGAAACERSFSFWANLFWLSGILIIYVRSENLLGLRTRIPGAICTHLHMIDSMWRVVVVSLSVQRYMF